MASNERFENQVSKWLEESVPARLPERVLNATFERTRTSRQHVGWRAFLRPPEMLRFAAVLGSATVLVAVAAVALSFYGNRQGIGVPPTPSANPTIGASPSPDPSSPPNSMWPQTTLDEVQAAQAAADAGDPAIAWQINPNLGPQVGQHHPGDTTIFARFLAQELGWDHFTWDEAAAHPDNLEPGEVVFIRCAPGATNPLYPTDSEDPGCAPTLDEVRYETVKIKVAQPVRQDDTGVWVVTGWEMIEPFQQTVPPSDGEIAASLGAFLQARVDGEGAEEFRDFAAYDPFASDRVDREIPLLYATSTGAPYERSEFELVDGPVWPSGAMRFEARLFAQTGDTVVRQLFSLDRDGAGRVRVVYDFQPTTENGTAVPVEYGFLDGEVTYRAAFPLEPSQDGYRDQDRLALVGLLPDDENPRRVLLMLADPRPIGPGCVAGPASADAEALAQSIQSDPDFQATAPVAVTIGGISALQMDVVLAPGASSCSWSEPEVSTTSPLLLKSAPVALGADRARLYLVDLPGGSARVLALAIISDADSLQTVLGYATPVIESIELHAP